MIHYKEAQLTTKTLESITCDICQTHYDDPLDIQEFLRIHDTGGYNSAIGDCTTYECDICSRCLKQLLGKHLRIVEELYG